MIDHCAVGNSLVWSPPFKFLPAYQICDVTAEKLTLELYKESRMEFWKNLYTIWFFWSEFFNLSKRCPFELMKALWIQISDAAAEIQYRKPGRTHVPWKRFPSHFPLLQAHRKIWGQWRFFITYVDIIRNVTWYVMKVQIYEILCNICLFSSSSLCPVLAVSVLYFENKLGIGCVNISKIHNFIRYQITFLMTCQQH